MNRLNIIKNNIKALHNYYKKAIFLDNMPTYFWIEPTNHCNLRCIMCPSGAGKVEIEKGYMKYDFFKKIVEEIKGYASAITIAVNGESLLHPDFFKMVRYATNRGIKVLLNTNATLLNEKKAKLMLESGIASISFAFDGFNKSMYEKARIGATYETTLENILYFLRLRREKKKKLPYTVLSILMLEIDGCHEEVKQAFLKQFKGLIDEIRLREVSTWGSTFKETKNFAFRENTANYLPCSRLWSTAVIAW
ncbi:MAG: radical SAM protein, partial [Thermotogota bacterium]|nr:radical SAM protein [Thermotogota bacterium]